MQNISLSAGLKRVCPSVRGHRFVASSCALPSEKRFASAEGLATTEAQVHARSNAQAHAHADIRTQTGTQAQATAMPAQQTIFLASVFARLAPVLALLLVLWTAIAWSIGWMGGVAG